MDLSGQGQGVAGHLLQEGDDLLEGQFGIGLGERVLASLQVRDDGGEVALKAGLVMGLEVLEAGREVRQGVFVHLVAHVHQRLVCLNIGGRCLGIPRVEDEVVDCTLRRLLRIHLALHHRPAVHTGWK